jgi:lipopolysaccharide assembly outer membrane protein LptD (OstA)
MNLNAQCAAARTAMAALGAAALLAACTPSQSKPITGKSIKRSSSSTSSLPPNLGLAGEGAMINLPDPKHPDWLLWKLWVKSYLGDLSENQVTAQGVSALLYTDGRKDAKLYAPQAAVNTKTEDIHAFGGVTYDSLKQSGTSLHAQSVTWNARTKHGEAQGNVHYHNGKNGMNVDTPVLYFNSGMQVVQSTPLE